ncbi:MAG TPA: hypothetical protein PK156_21300 [Polyangium sp.]|nr:hypothetical protein [Polyangium sp.]
MNSQLQDEDVPSGINRTPLPALRFCPVPELGLAQQTHSVTCPASAIAAKRR